MNVFKRLLGLEEEKQKRPEQAVIVQFTYGKTDMQLIFDLESRLEEAIVKAGVGEFDGNDMAQDGSEGFLYMYGPDADKLFEVIEPILEDSDFLQGASAKIRYGPPEEGVPVKRLIIGSS